jgi:hypothetical protein
LRENEGVSARIKELQTVVAERVVSAEVRRSSWRVQILQNRLDKMLALSEARAVMYAEELGESHQFQVADRVAEFGRDRRGMPRAAGLRAGAPVDWADIERPPAPPEYPKTMVHPGYLSSPHSTPKQALQRYTALR